MSTTVLGVYTGDIHATPQHDLGTYYTDRAGTKWQYVKADANAKVAYTVYVIASDFTLTDAVAYHATDNCFKLGVPQMAFTASYYGWVAVQGPMTVKVLANAVVKRALYTTATAGSLDDTATSQLKVPGLTVNATVGGSAADTPCFAAIELFSMLGTA